MHAFPLDVVGPGTVVAAGIGLGGGLVLLLLIVLVEAVVLRVMKWALFWRSALGSLLMNAASTVVGLLLLFLILTGTLGGTTFVLLAFVLSVLIEGGVLMLMKRSTPRENWLAALVANIITYIPVGALYLWNVISF